MPNILIYYEDSDYTESTIWKNATEITKALKIFSNQLLD